MEDPEEFVQFLEQYLANYSDYTTLENIKKGDAEYADICISTADFLYDLLKEGSEETIGNPEELLPFLEKKTIIMGGFDTTNQCHWIAMIPYNGKVFVIQSLGGIYGAYYETWRPEELIEELKKISKGKTMGLFHFVDTIGKDSKVTFYVSKRKSISKDLLPSFRPYQRKINKLREKHLKNFEEIDNELLEKLGLELDRPADAYLRISQMSILR